MIVKEITLKNYRKFEEASFTFKPGINLIVGKNASGKTTIVQAIVFAIYGETLTGLSLAQLLRHDTQKQTDFGLVKLVLENSEKLWVSREIKMVNKTPTQKILVGEEEIITHDINAIRKIFPEKELFYKLAFIDLESHSLLDVNRRPFRELLSRHTLTWDIQRVLDSSKSLHVYLQSREKLYEERVRATKTVSSEYDFITGKIKDLQNEKKELTTELLDTETFLASAERTQTMETAKRERILSVVENLEKTLEEAQKLARRLPRNEEALSDIEEIYNHEGGLPRQLIEYFQRVRYLYGEVQDFSEQLNNLAKLKEGFMSYFEKKRRSLSAETNLQKARRGELVVRIEQTSQTLIEYEKQMKKLEETAESLAEYESELQKYEVAYKLADALESLILASWRKNFASFISNVKDHVNERLEDMGINLGLQVTDSEMQAIIQGKTVPFETLSAGEREVLNLLVRTTALRELEETSILILEHPTAFLDRGRTSRILSFLNSLKKEFTQIIITTVREDLPLDVENKITLTD